MCGLLNAIVHGECQHDLLPEDGHDAYLSDSQWRHRATNQSTEQKRRRGEVCACKHVQEMVGLFLAVHAIWERSLGSKNGSEGLPSLTVNRGAKKSKITGNHLQSKTSRALLFCLKTACRRDVPVSTMRFTDAPKAKKNQPEKGQV